MQFNSYIFIMAILPLSVMGYFASNRIHIKLGKICLILFSLLFYMYGNSRNAFVLLISVFFNLIMAKLISSRKEFRKLLLSIAIAFHVSLLFYYKYINFVIMNLNEFFHRDFSLYNIILPLGISFITFQQISYLVMVYKNEIKEIDSLDYFTYILYFPKILMGPLVDPLDFINQLNDNGRKRIDYNNIISGIKLFSFGLFKKVILADTFSNAVLWGFDNVEKASSLEWLLIMLFYTFEIYFDFSGYSDMAVGISQMMNITLPINFNSPYKAISIRDFWDRWHITLTKFLTKYIYIPLGGNRKGRIRTYINILIVFLISGIWHGANWTFILWGVIYGALCVCGRIFERPFEKLVESVRWMGTFLVVNLLWLLFRAESISQWWHILGRIFTFQSMDISDDLINCFSLPEADFLIDFLHLEMLNQSMRGMWVFIFAVGAFLLCMIPENNYKKMQNNGMLITFFAAIAFVWSFICLSSESVFVYFSF